MTPQKSRNPIRFLCGFVALVVAAYLVEIYFMGAPTFGRGGGRSFRHETDPIPFWTHFTLFALLGASAGYLCFDWKRALSIIAFVEAKDQWMLDVVGAEKARRIQRHRLFQVAGLAFGLVVVGALLIGLCL